MAYGLGTWDGASRPTNVGIVPVFVMGWADVGAGVTSGSWSYSIPTGMVLDCMLVRASGGAAIVAARKRVTSSGNTVTLSPVANNDISAGTFPDDRHILVFYAR